MSRTPSDEQLWSWVDRAAPELDEHLQRHPQDERRVAELRAAIGRIEATDPHAAMPERIGEYAIRGVLGSGGMGCVYDAEQDHPRRRVALKVLPSDVASDARRLALFRREADALARLSHPGIAAIYGVGQGADGRPHIAMERIEGRPLSALIGERGSNRERLQLARKIAEAVGHAHDHGVVHRDLKPANVIVNSQGAPVVVDFGLARIEDDDSSRVSVASRSGELMGTLAYMSPEQVAGRGALDPASDVYSLGVLLFELFTGKLPHDLSESSLVDAARRIQNDPPLLRRAERRALSGDLGLVVLKALEKDPVQRYASAGELAAELQRCLDGRPVHAVRRSVARCTGRFLRRHWVGASLVATLGLVGLLLVLPVRVPIPLGASWWRNGAPYEDLRWFGDTPEVKLDGRWYGLVAIDDLKSGYLVGFCQQNSDGNWRKRFSEDLVQVLNRLGHLGFGSVTLTLRDRESGELTLWSDAPLDSGWRRQIQARRHAWPWTRDWEPVAIDGASFEGIERHDLYDSYCDRLGRSPGERVDVVLRHRETGVERSFTNVARLGSPVEADQ